MTRILVEISSHGFGHLAQTAPVVNGLRQRIPGLDVVVRSGLPKNVLKARLGQDIRVIQSDHDFGVVQSAPLVVDGARTLQAHRGIYERREQLDETSRTLLRDVSPDLILANAGFLTFKVANELGIPAVGMSSLNWAEVLRAYAGNLPGADTIIASMREDYSAAHLFLRLEPGIAMPGLTNLADVGPIAAKGRKARDLLLKRLGAPEEAKVILFAFGGDPPAPPQLDDIDPSFVLVGPKAWERNFVAADQIGLPFPDLVASADVVVAKLGYGIVVEAAFAGAPMIAYGRASWPENDILMAWLQRHGRVALRDGAVESMASNSLEQDTARLLGAVSPAGPADGLADVVDHLQSLVGTRA